MAKTISSVVCIAVDKSTNAVSTFVTNSFTDESRAD